MTDMFPGIEDYRVQIEAALRYCAGTHTFSDVCHSVQAGRLQFWPGPRSVIITEIIEYPQRKVLHFFLAGGVMTEIEAMVPGVEAWGESQGCTAAMTTGRPGWERTFLTKQQGWASTHVVFQKELNNVTRSQGRADHHFDRNAG